MNRLLPALAVLFALSPPSFGQANEVKDQVADLVKTLEKSRASLADKRTACKLLAGLGPRAKEAVPALVKTLADEDESLIYLDVPDEVYEQATPTDFEPDR